MLPMLRKLVFCDNNEVVVFNMIVPLWYFMSHTTLSVSPHVLWFYVTHKEPPQLSSSRYTPLKKISSWITHPPSPVKPVEFKNCQLTVTYQKENI